MSRSQLALVPNENEAYNACPWANQVIETPAGFMCFEDAADGTEWLLAHDVAIAKMYPSLALLYSQAG